MDTWWIVIYVEDSRTQIYLNLFLYNLALFCLGLILSSVSFMVQSGSSCPKLRFVWNTKRSIP